MNPDSHALRQLAIDWRLVLMGAVLLATAVVFNLLSGGLFLAPENLYNIAQRRRWWASCPPWWCW